MLFPSFLPASWSCDCPFRALETNKYNHITATYYLLAERILREKQEKEVQNRSSSPSNIKAQFRYREELLSGFCSWTTWAPLA